MTCRIFSAASLVLFTTALILLVIVCLQTDLLIQTYTEDCSEEKGLPKVEHQATLGPFKGCLDSGGMGSQCGRVDGNCNIQGVSKYNFTECDDKSLQPQENEGGVYPYGQLCRVHISMEVIVIVACVFLFVCVVLQALSLSNISAKQCDRLTVIFGAVGGVCALVFLAFFGALPELAKNLGAESIGDYVSFSYERGGMFWQTLVAVGAIWVAVVSVCVCGCCCRKDSYNESSGGERGGKGNKNRQDKVEEIDPEKGDTEDEIDQSQKKEKGSEKEKQEEKPEDNRPNQVEVPEKEKDEEDKRRKGSPEEDDQEAPLPVIASLPLMLAAGTKSVKETHAYGWYGYDDPRRKGEKGEMSFATFSITSAKISGAGRDVVGPFTISGTVVQSGDGAVCKFLKKYEGKHNVDYEGSISENTSQIAIAGKWRLSNDPGYAGAFELFCLK